MLKINKSSHLIDSVEYLPSTNCDKRPQGYLIDTIIIHCISLPEGIFDNNNVADLFMNNLDLTKHPTFKSLKDLKVSSHVFIKRNGQIAHQFVQVLAEEIGTIPALGLIQTIDQYLMNFLGVQGHQCFGVVPVIIARGIQVDPLAVVIGPNFGNFVTGHALAVKIEMAGGYAKAQTCRHQHHIWI